LARRVEPFFILTQMPSFSNLEYLYNHLPARFRREDRELFLKRYLQFFGETLDEWDETYLSFFERINPQTAGEEWVEFWLRELFGWSWFPYWFTVTDKRRLYHRAGPHARAALRRVCLRRILFFRDRADAHHR
jgi:hypothetical protein